MRPAAMPALSLLACLTAAAGCSTVSVTVPKRSATEQLLISTAADRALARHDELADLRDKRVFVDVQYLDGYDKPYVALALRGAVARAGGRLVDERSLADLVLEAASGALSIDKASWLLGVPETSIPLQALGTLQIPELALLKSVRQKGKAKIAVLIYQADSRRPLAGPRTTMGSAFLNSWWFFFLGPFDFTNLPDWPDEK